jgi:hypothetical protein
MQNPTRASTLPRFPPSLLAAPVYWLGAPVLVLVGQPIADGAVSIVVAVDVETVPIKRSISIPHVNIETEYGELTNCAGSNGR